MRLEVGPGFSNESIVGRAYCFKPKLVGEDVVYLDINMPLKEFRKYMWIVGDAHRLPFRDEAFDEVYSSHVIEHLENPLRFLRECHRVLKGGGVLRIWCPNFLSKASREDPTHRHVFTPLSLRRLMRKAGFRVWFEEPPSPGGLLPKPLRILIRRLYIMLMDEIRVEGVKWSHD